MNPAAFTGALLDPALPCPPGLVAWNGSDPARRFAVHRNNVLVSLVDALADTFPVVQALVGEQFFRAMAALFVRHAPPHSPVLAHYGEGLAAFIEGFEPARQLPYLADMARLEYARVRAYHAADAAPVAGLALQQALAQPDRLAQLRLTCHPSVRVVASRYAVVSLWAAHQLPDVSTLPDPWAGAEATLVLRDGLDVLVLPVATGTAAFVGALLAGAAFAEAAAAPQTDLPAALALLARHGALVSIHWPEEGERR